MASEFQQQNACVGGTSALSERLLELEKMTFLSLGGDGETESVWVRPRSSSTGCDTILKTVGYSKGFQRGRYLNRSEVPVVLVTGAEIRNSRGMDPHVAKHLQTYYVKRILSPFEFYLEKESLMACVPEAKRHDKMQAHYAIQDYEAYEYFIHVSKMKCYACYEPKSKSWWRVRVHDVDLEKGQAFVYYCDTGRREYVPCESLRQLESQFFGTWDSAILKCYMYDILPADGSMTWSIQAIASFKELLEDRRLGGVVMRSTSNPAVEYGSDVVTDCGVVLIDKDKLENSDTINWLMVKMGHARSIGIMSCSPSVLDIPGLIPSFDVPGEKKPRKPIKYDSRGIEPQMLREITTKAMAHFDGLDVGKPAYLERPSEQLSNPENYLPFSIRSRLAWMRLSFVSFGPGQIYIHTRNKKLELKAMEAKMQKVCKELPRPKITDLKPGSLVTCDMKDPVDSSQDAWCRSVVLSVNTARQAVKVLMVDYGNILLVHISIIYQLPKQYRSIPSFVHRIHLSDIRPNYEVPEWPNAINKFFFKVLLSHEIDQPLYYVHLADQNDSVKFTDFGNAVSFDVTTNKWVESAQAKPSEEFEALNSLKDDPLVAAHFHSHGVRIFYEVAVGESKYWEFENLSDYLVKREYAVFVMPRAVDKDKLHEICRIGCGTL